MLAASSGLRPAQWLALLPLGCCLRIVDDTTSLVQQQAALGEAALLAVRSGGQGPELLKEQKSSEAGTRKAEANETLEAWARNGMTMSWNPVTEDYNQKVTLGFGGLCGENELGVGSCAMLWDMPATMQLNFALPEGLTPGSFVEFHLQLNIASRNSSNPLALLTPEELYLYGGCATCRGVCKFFMPNKMRQVHILFPTVFDGDEWCYPSTDGRPTAQSALLELPALGQLALTGQLTVDMSATDPVTHARADNYYVFRLGQMNNERALDLRKVHAKMTPKSRPAMGFGRAVGKLLGSSLERAAKAAFGSGIESTFGRIHNSKRRQDSKRHALVVNVTLKHIEGNAGQNVTFYPHGANCIRTDGHGSTSCKLPLDEVYKGSLFLDLSLELEEGDTMTLRTLPVTSGKLSNLLSGAFLASEHELPLCGKTPTTVLIEGQPRRVQPLKCGKYAFRLVPFKPSSRNFADFGDIDISEIAGGKSLASLAATLDSALPLGLATGWDLRHRDGSPMLSLDLHVGMDTL